MKVISYPARLTIPFDEQAGSMLDEIATTERRDRPATVLHVLAFYYAHVFHLHKGQGGPRVEPRRRA